MHFLAYSRQPNNYRKFGNGNGKFLILDFYGGKDKELFQTFIKDFKKNGGVLVDLLSSESSLFHFFSDGRIVLEFILYLFQQFLLRVFFSFGINFFIQVSQVNKI